jgi:hypothetical protein
MERTYHFTVGTKVPSIAESGSLQPIGIDLEPGEHPVLWFSAAILWEETATKLLFNPCTGRIQRPSMFDLHCMLGVYRFGIAADDARLVPWPKLRRAAAISDDVTRRLVRNGRAVGARPEQWSGSLVAISVADLTFEAWRPLSGWAPANLRLEADERRVLAATIRHASAGQVRAEATAASA